MSSKLKHTKRNYKHVPKELELKLMNINEISNGNNEISNNNIRNIKIYKEAEAKAKEYFEI